MPDLSVNIAGVKFKNPLIAASGCVGFGQEYEKFFPLSTLGGISVKGLTPAPRDGNAPVRVAETAAGMLNSVGLQNPGIDAFIKDELPRLAGKDTVVIANIAGETAEQFALMAKKLDETAVDMLEVNVSCPNVKEGGMAFGVSGAETAKVTRAVRKATAKPVMVKLSPNVTDITEIARAAEAEGADAISLINTLLGMRIDINTRKPVLDNIFGGLSGPAVFPVALRMVWQTARAVSIPVVGMGGVSNEKTAIEMMLAGAAAVQIGTALFSDPMCPVKIINGLNKWLEEQGIAKISELNPAFPVI
ncbi:MAG: dihydroorotate dehydrogenase [Oscillospiraceae bacterium]|nr:dihydroorotate dehydrogenase [Oscillospiraceae bacterium]